ncbi:hypothetical protein E1B25_17490 [Antarcticimicrobium sediminis]|uniref:Uncharacterized protein n=1 Tax=Antarcticimicrobium sediminis TaxID=2546227 RepID=A0A4R5ELL5_9RHOB|nr:hypothetical protein E1B25_17490 [Antarcticimicrobium sediminis]
MTVLHLARMSGHGRSDDSQVYS